MNTSKVAIVTGAGGMRGTGRAIALELARAGWRITLVDIERAPGQIPPDEVEAGWQGIHSVAREIEAAGSSALPVSCDIRQSDQVQSMVDRTVAHFGRLDLLVNNARAILGRAAEVIDMEESDWDTTMAVNAKGNFLCSRAVARHMVKQGTRGRIVNISSVAGKTGSRGKAGAAYSASKFAINGLTQCLALELAPHGINVNAICPGTIESGRFNLSEKLAAEKEGISLQEYERRRVARLAAQIPTGRLVQPGEVAAMVMFLVSPAADNITGQAFNINGGTLFH